MRQWRPLSSRQQQRKQHMTGSSCRPHHYHLGEQGVGLQLGLGLGQDHGGSTQARFSSPQTVSFGHGPLQVSPSAG